VVVCGVVSVVSCVVLLFLCVCVCDLVLLLHTHINTRQVYAEGSVAGGGARAAGERLFTQT